MIIQDEGGLQKRKMSNDSFAFVECNIIEGPFVIRRDVFNNINGFKPSHGDTALLDFFLRSNGTLKIASSLNCTFNDEQLANNRGAMLDKEVYLDYGLLGFNHNILRVIRRDSIIWTQCTRNESFCPNKPLQEINTTISRQLSPFCCNVALNRYLIDAVSGLQQAGMDYRLSSGTALGAVRTKNIIPWTQDIDIDVTLQDYQNSLAFDKLNIVLNLRIIPLFPFKIEAPDMSSYDLFSQNVLDKLQCVLPIQHPNWRSQGYVDIYPYKEFTATPSYVTINGQNYKTHKNAQAYLVKLFGINWREPNYSRNAPSISVPWVGKSRNNLVQEDKPANIEANTCIIMTRRMFWPGIIAIAIAVRIFFYRTITTFSKSLCDRVNL